MRTSFLPWLVLLLIGCPEVPDTDRDLPLLEHQCMQTGGVLTEQRCCLSTGHFPATCGDVDPCGACPEDETFEAEMCDCGLEACFDGNYCELLTF